SLMCGFLQRWFLRHSSAAFSVLEYIHPVSLMLAPHRHVSTHCSLIVSLHLVGAVFYPIAVVVCCCYGVPGCVCPCAPSPVFGGFSHRTVCSALFGDGYDGREPAVEFFFRVSIQCVRRLSDVGFSYHLSGRRVWLLVSHWCFPLGS